MMKKMSCILVMKKMYIVSRYSEEDVVYIVPHICDEEVVIYVMKKLFQDIVNLQEQRYTTSCICIQALNEVHLPSIESSNQPFNICYFPMLEITLNPLCPTWFNVFPISCIYVH